MAASSSIQNLNKPKDAFEQLEDEEGTRQGFCHIRIQQRTGRKTITTVQGIAPEYDLKKIVRYLKKMLLNTGWFVVFVLLSVITSQSDGLYNLDFRKMLTNPNFWILRLIFLSPVEDALLYVLPHEVYFVQVSFTFHMRASLLRNPSAIRSVMLSKFTLLCALIILRLVNVFLVRTYFVPDELFQSVEVAHWAVYGTGYLSWEWMASLRSALHPFIIALLYLLGHALNIDSNLFIIQIPRILHALLFALSDYCYYKIAKRILPSDGAKYALLCYLSCWFVWYCAPRTLSNTLETVLTLFALQWYPLSKADFKKSCWPYMTIGFLAILIRPTAVLIWIPFGLWHLWRSDSRLALLLNTCLLSCFPVLVFVVVLDSVAYGKPTLTIWNFIRFNVLEGGSSHFGSHPWHWFISQGLPAVLTVHLIPICWGIVNAIRSHSIPFIFFWVPLFYITVHSCIEHKEHRFLLPAIPFFCLFAGIFFHNRLFHMLKRYYTVYIGFSLITNIILALYFGLFHQVGPFSASDWIIKNANLRFSRGQHFELVQLMPCFSLPQYSYFHDFNVTITTLDCSPNLLHDPEYIDETDLFNNNPKLWIDANLELVRKAHYLVFYEKTYREEYNCNGTTVDHPEYGEVIQLTGDQRQHIKDFLCRVGIVKEENCKIHGF
uniref:Mannosyltransferase n=1 Tax=Setaria digitata TaxID=48799 RepID=A0A915PZE9_9BILA